jgi:uncharacterized protein
MKGHARMVWHRRMQQWHWVSAGICLAALLLFSVTGFTLNHAASISSTPRVERRSAELPASLRALLIAPQNAAHAGLPRAVEQWVAQQFDLRLSARDTVEWSDDEVYVSAPAAGRDTWLSVDRASGAVEYESTRRGVVAWLNDLHKGRHTSGLWQVFIDLVAVACFVFAFTGLALLQLAARQRRATWPVVGSGVLTLGVLMVLASH